MSLNDVLLTELRDLYSAENQLVKAMPKTVKAISDPGMKQVLKDHQEEAKSQVLRLREVFSHLGKKATGQHCNGMEGCVKELTEALEEDYTGAIKDAAVMGAALRVVHYEIAGYTAAIAIAKAIGNKEIVTLLTETLSGENSTAKSLLASAKPVLKAANSQEDEEDEEDGEEEDEEKDPEEKESEEESEKDEAEAEPELESAKKAPKKK